MPNIFAPFDGAFLYLDTYGLPLYEILAACSQNGVVVNLSAFYRDAAAAGWKREKVDAVVQEALRDASHDHFLFCVEDH